MFGMTPLELARTQFGFTAILKLLQRGVPAGNSSIVV
jgi:hypothetical protein